jgi:DNA-binding transcriptional MerR regulator
MPLLLIYLPELFKDRRVNQQATIFAISDLAREFGITPRTIRFWEDQGILAPQREGSKRVFTRRDRARLKMALRGKRLGLSLAEIKDLIGMYASTEDETPQLLECLRVMSKRREALQQQREDIEAMLAEIAQFEQQCRQELARRDAGQ